ncbi:MAG: hypothetical protein WBA76_08205 [Phormidesmis sp.]
MTFFELNEPLLPPQSETVGMQDLHRLVRAQFKCIAERLAMPFPSVSFTELDQAFLVWGFIALTIFALPQFSGLSWTKQALIDAALTGLGIVSTAKLTWRLACSENLRWVVGLWTALMSGGMVATAYGIFYSVGIILANLCLLWLGLCTAGYLAMGVGLRSRSFTLASLVHGLAIMALQIHPAGQFFISGLVMSLTLFFFSVVPWDMRAVEAEELCGLKPSGLKPSGLKPDELKSAANSR